MSDDKPRVTRVRQGQAEDGVRHIAKMMADGQWITGASHEAVATLFAVSERTVEGWAIQASRALRMSIGDGEELRGRLAAMLERHERVAMQRVGVTMKGDEYANPDVKAATGAVKTLAELMGLVTQKHEHTHTVQSFAALPPPEKAQRLRELASKLNAEADRLDSAVVVPALPAA